MGIEEQIKAKTWDAATKKARLDSSIRMAKSLLLEGLPIDLIVRTTQLPEDTVSNLKAELRMA